MNFLKSILDSIKDFFMSIKELFSSSKEEEDQVDPEVVEDNTPVDDGPTEEEVVVPSVPEEEASFSSEPAKSSKDAVISTFLWKPTSDVNPNPVIVVACDQARSGDLRCEVISKTGKQLAFLKHSGSRANQLPGFKYGRVHFRLNKTAKALVRSAPLKVKFFLELKGKSLQLKGRKGNDSFAVKNPLNRIDRR